ncbi:ATPase [Microbacterium sp.]|uniref:ATPase n=1 Tax=Microbacterium sp. TaxID=51671 RepID=UPI0037353862
MKKALWFVLGIAGGFVAAHFVNKDPRGQELLSEVDLRISEFTDRIAEAYREQEARIEGIVAGAKDVAEDLADSVADAAQDAGAGIVDAVRAPKTTD